MHRASHTPSTLRAAVRAPENPRGGGGVVWEGRTRRWQKGVYWYIIGSVTCSSNPDSLPSRTKGPSNEWVGTGAGAVGNVASDRLWWISQATLSNTRWICHFQTYSFTRKHTHTYIDRERENDGTNKMSEIPNPPTFGIYLYLVSIFLFLHAYRVDSIWEDIRTLNLSLVLSSSSRIEYEWNKKQLKQNESLSASLMKDERWNGSICVFMPVVFYTPSSIEMCTDSV